MKNVKLNSNVEYHHICYTCKCNDTNLIYSSKDSESWKEITEEEYLKIQEIGKMLKRHQDVQLKSYGKCVFVTTKIPIKK